MAAILNFKFQWFWKSNEIMSLLFQKYSKFQEDLSNGSRVKSFTVAEY